MRWIGLRGVPFILCFIFGLVLVAAHRVSQYRLPDTLSTPVETLLQDNPVELSIPHLRFRYYASGCGGRNDDGSEGSVIAFKASDGGIVSYSIFGYRTPQLARQAMLLKLSESEDVLDAGGKSRNDRKGSGDRAVIKFRSVAGRFGAEIIWTEGVELNLVSGPTLGHVLGVENLRPDR